MNYGEKRFIHSQQDRFFPERINHPNTGLNTLESGLISKGSDSYPAIYVLILTHRLLNNSIPAKKHTLKTFSIPFIIAQKTLSTQGKGPALQLISVRPPL